MPNPKHAARTEDTPRYTAQPAPAPQPDEDAIILRALEILRERLDRSAMPVMSSPADVKNYLKLSLARLQREVFGVLFLDSQHRLLDDETLFSGTLTQTSVYPREVVKAALACNAGAVVLYHNHPSGNAEPSEADKYLTATLKRALDMVDIRVLDHLLVGGVQCTSFAERGLL